MTEEKNRIEALLDDFHRAAATGNGKVFFDLIDDAQGTYVGTDQEEHWTKEAFAGFAMPYFDRGPAWDFKAVERHVFIREDSTMAWFDEWLHTWMQGCRGSGVFIKVNGEWKMGQYVLSMTLPTCLVTDVRKEKAAVEAPFLEKRTALPVVYGEPNSVHTFLDAWHRAVAANDAQHFTDHVANDVSAVTFYAPGHVTSPTELLQMLSDIIDSGAEKGSRAYQAVERHVYVTQDGQFAWFDELFNGSMKGFRASGVLEKKKNDDAAWSVKHYVLSATIPNDMAKPLVPRKQAEEGEMLSRLLKNRNGVQ